MSVTEFAILPYRRFDVLEDMKAHLNITFDDDDAIILQKAFAAAAFIGKYLEGNIYDDGEGLIVYRQEVPNGPVTVEWSGWADDDSREAVRQVAAFLYENREMGVVSTGMTLSMLPFVESFITNNRGVSFGYNG